MSWTFLIFDKVFPFHDTNEYRGRREIPPPILNPCIRRSWLVSFTPRSLSPYSHTGRFEEEKHLLSEPGSKPWPSSPYSRPWLISNLMYKILIYLHIIHLLKSSTCFEHYPGHLQEGYVVIVYVQPLVSSLSAGDCLVHRLRKKCSFFLTHGSLHHESMLIKRSNLMQQCADIYLLQSHSTCFGCHSTHHQ